MALTDSLRILITANGAQAEREFSRVGSAARRSLGQAEQSSVRFGRQLTSAGVAMATFGGVALVGLYKAAQAADAENLAIAQLNTAFANSPVLVGQSTDALLAQAAALQDTTRYEDDATVGMQALLATFRLTSDQISTLTPLVQDLASFWHTDLDTAAKQVGKAMQGNIGALQRSGVQIDETAYATDRFGAILSALRENAGGFAASEGQTMAGQLEILKNNLGDVAEGIGQGAIPAFQSMLSPVQSVTDAFTGMSAENQKAIGTVLTFGAVGLTAAGGTLFLAGQVLQLGATFTALKGTMLGTRIGLLALNPAFQAVAGAAAAAGVAYLLFTSDASTATEELEGHMRALSRATTSELGDAATALAVFGEDKGLDELRSLAEENIVVAERLGRAWIDIGGPADEINGVLGEVAQENVMLAQAGENAADVNARLAESMGGVTDAADEATGASSRLAETWGGLGDRLGDFNAALDAQQALYGLQDALAAANEDGTITAREMVDLNQSLSGLVGSYQSVAEANNTAADGSVNFRGRNRELRASLGALASFIPAELRPQFRLLTQDVLAVPDNANIDVTSNVRDTLAAFQALPAAIKYAADTATNNGQGTTGVMANEGGRGPESAAAGPRPSVVTEDGIGRAVARHLSKTVQPIVNVRD